MCLLEKHGCNFLLDEIVSIFSSLVSSTFYLMHRFMQLGINLRRMKKLTRFFIILSMKRD